MKVKALTEHGQNALDMEGASQVKMRMLIGPEENAPTFHMREFEVAPGGHTPHHAHDFEHEILVLSGNCVAKSEQGDRPMAGGDVIFVPANEKHQFVNAGGEPLRFVCLIPAPRDCST